jgi:hypothetical protein
MWRKNQVAVAITGDNGLHRLALVALFEDGFRLQHQAALHGPAEQLLAIFVNDENTAPAQRAKQLAQRRGAAVGEGSGGRCHHHFCGWAGVNASEGGAFTRLVAQPEHTANADGGGHLCKQDRSEKFPEQAAHGYSRINW